MKQSFTIVLEGGLTKEVEGDRIRINGYDCFISEEEGESLCGKWTTYTVSEYRSGMKIFDDTDREFAIKRAGEMLSRTHPMELERHIKGKLIHEGVKRFPINI